MAKKALLIVDMLNDFLVDGAPLQVPGGLDIVPNIRREIGKVRQEGIPVIHACDRHAPDDPEFNHWPPHAVKGTPGADIVEGLIPQAGDIVVEKTRYDAFLGTDLDERLKALGIDTIILTGVTTEICIHYTGAQAVMRGYRVEIPPDCVKGLWEDKSNAAMGMLNEVLQKT